MSLCKGPNNNIFYKQTGESTRSMHKQSNQCAGLKKNNSKEE